MAIYKKDGVDGVNSFPRKLVGLKISIADGSSVTVGDWMAIDTSFTTEGVGAGCKVTTASDETVFGVSNGQKINQNRNNFDPMSAWKESIKVTLISSHLTFVGNLKT